MARNDPRLVYGHGIYLSTRSKDINSQKQLDINLSYLEGCCYILFTVLYRPFHSTFKQ